MDFKISQHTARVKRGHECPERLYFLKTKAHFNNCNC